MWWRDRKDRGHRNRLREPFRSLGGSIGTAAFGAVFAAHWVQTVFLVAAPVAIAGLLVVLLLEAVPLGGPATVKGA